MRHPDGLRQQGHSVHEAPNTNGSNGSNGMSNGAYQKIFPPVGVHDYQEFPSRRPNTASNATVPRARYEVPAPLPGYHPPSLQTHDHTRLVGRPIPC